jgi:DNA-binding transcriptional MerR regulator
MNEKRYTVSEAVRLIGVESHVLRYWEEELRVPIERTSQGHRCYSPENVTLFQQVKVLRERGLQMKAIRAWMEEQKTSAAMDEDDRWENQETALPCEVISDKEPSGSLEVFVTLLKQMMEEVAQEQDARLARMLEDCIRDELEELYLQYFQALSEAAATKERAEHRNVPWERSNESDPPWMVWLKRIWHRLFS